MSKIQKKIDAFFAKYRLKSFDRGTVLMFPGEEVKQIFYLSKGTVKQCSASKGGDEVVLNLFKPGAFFPMANTINDIPIKYLLEIESDAEIRVAPKDEVIRFLKQNPDVVYDLLSRVYRGTEGLLGRLEHLMISGAGSRFVYELLIEAKRFGTKTVGGEVVVNTSEKAIGERAGLSRETINREIRKLKDKKLISIKRKAIIIPDIKKLESTLD